VERSCGGSAPPSVGEVEHHRPLRGRPFSARTSLHRGRQLASIVRLAFGHGAAAEGGGRGLVGGRAWRRSGAFAAADCAAGIAKAENVSHPGRLERRPTLRRGFSSFMPSAMEGLLARPQVFASSSARLRRIDAKISSIEGYWTFAGCGSFSGPHITKGLVLVLQPSKTGLPIG